MPTPLSLLTILSRKRLAQDVEEIEEIAARDAPDSVALKTRLRDLRLALESDKPLYGRSG